MPAPRPLRGEGAFLSPRPETTSNPAHRFPARPRAVCRGVGATLSCMTDPVLVDPQFITIEFPQAPILPLSLEDCAFAVDQLQERLLDQVSELVGAPINLDSVPPAAFRKELKQGDGSVRLTVHYMPQERLGGYLLGGPLDGKDVQSPIMHRLYLPVVNGERGTLAEYRRAGIDPLQHRWVYQYFPEA